MSPLADVRPNFHYPSGSGEMIIISQNPYVYTTCNQECSMDLDIKREQRLHSYVCEARGVCSSETAPGKEIVGTAPHNHNMLF